MLIQEGADVLDVDPASGLTPLMLAARGGHAELCKVGRAGSGREARGMQEGGQTRVLHRHGLCRVLC